eukprot:CAMPEP_0196570358 /NCGR_PEP_ID=MMETSP1081-20130531/429_1 /TAXON_ID=36882 /ORGANISM="Pyramimonas amylifera, Strain CCMP720" /LENGTH=321 /DNA_ID=CAMNT_0041886753 /DNA_START=113 /DNA_END=1079 /DNA_ORIENTATION=+
MATAFALHSSVCVKSKTSVNRPNNCITSRLNTPVRTVSLSAEFRLSSKKSCRANVFQVRASKSNKESEVAPEEEEEEEKEEKKVEDIEEVADPVELLPMGGGETGDVLEGLRNGFLSFRSKAEKKLPELIDQLKLTQEPKVMVIACADSRVSPTMLMQTKPGDIFVVRNVANLVPPYEKQGKFHGTSAALEFAVCHLKVEHIIIMGHSGCGGIKALMDESFEETLATNPIGMEFIPNWVSTGQPARERIRRTHPNATFEEQCRECEELSINASLSNLLTFPFLKEAISSRELHIHGAYYNLQELSLKTWSMDVKISKPTVV